MTAFIAGILYRAALEAQHRRVLDDSIAYPLYGDDVFRVLLRAMEWPGL